MNAATMTPIVAELVSSVHPHLNSGVLWWALALGTDLGGNLTAVGASANVIVIGIAQRAGNPISFWEFTRKGAVVSMMSLALCAGICMTAGITAADNDQLGAGTAGEVIHVQARDDGPVIGPGRGGCRVIGVVAVPSHNLFGRCDQGRPGGHRGN